MSTGLNNSVLKGFEILKLFSESRDEISAKDVVEELGLNQATAHRFLMTLEAAGALTSHKRGRFSLSFALEKLGQVAARSNHLGRLVQPHIDLASSELRESVMACRLGASGPVCVAVSPSRRPISVNIDVGTVLPMHASAQGKLWLAHMPEAERTERLDQLKLDRLSASTILSKEDLVEELASIRETGRAVNRGENEPDIGAVSVPVLQSTGEVVLTLSAFGMLSRFDDQLVHNITENLLGASEAISAELEGNRP